MMAFAIVTTIDIATGIAIIIAVAHNIFLDLGLENIKKSAKDKHVIYDLKSMFSADQVDISL